MRRVRSYNHGYTIVETIIFLAVTGGLLAGALALVGGQQAKTEFYQSVRDVNTQINDVLNDVATGYYSNPGGFSCIYGPNVGVGANTQGTNEQCIFIGRVMAFGTNTDPADVTLFNVIGNRLTGPLPTDPIVTTIVQANPKTLLSPDSNVLPGGLTVGKMVYRDNFGLDNDIGAVGIFSKFDQNYDGLLAGGQTTQLLAYLNTNYGAQAVSDIRNAINNDTVSTPSNTTGYITLCLLSGGTNQHALITLGGEGKLTTKVEIRGDRICP